MPLSAFAVDTGTGVTVLVMRSMSESESPRSLPATIQRASRKASPCGSFSTAKERETLGAAGVETSTSSTWWVDHMVT